MCIANSRPLTFFSSKDKHGNILTNLTSILCIFYLGDYLLKCYWLDFSDNGWVTDMNEIIVFLFILSMSPYIPVALHV